MITEDYVSFDVAKLLKEQGFKIPYDSFRGVYINGIFKRLNPGDGYGYNLGDEIVEVCSLQMAMKWLREVHNIYIQIMLDSWVLGDHSGYYIVIQKTDSDFEEVSPVDIDEVFFQTYEEAAEAGIKYCLEKLI